MYHQLKPEDLPRFLNQLRQEERGTGTIAKYSRDIQGFLADLPPDGQVTKASVLAWKERLTDRYAVSTVNTMLAALNRFFSFLGWYDCRVKTIKRQRQIFRKKERELNKQDYLRLLRAAKQRKNDRLYFLMETLSSTGIRVSELPFVTVESLATGWATVDCKGKRRTILLTPKLCRVLRRYCQAKGIATGPIFVTRTGKPMDRSNIWRELQSLCAQAGVDRRKVFPHNFRHLFAQAFYALKKDIAKLADLLGHASIETTRIYIMESGAEHLRQIEQLGFVL